MMHSSSAHRASAPVRLWFVAGGCACVSQVKAHVGAPVAHYADELRVSTRRFPRVYDSDAVAVHVAPLARSL
jgi:hypothetical protein